MTYLEKEWSLNVATAFLARIDYRLQQLSNQPFAGTISQKIKGVRSVIITKHNRLYYKIEGRKVIVLNMDDTRINPRKNKY